MKRTYYLIVFVLLIPILGFGQFFTPPLSGPGSPTYQHDSVIVHDYAKKQDGYWLFEPAQPRPATANVVVFIHGYGAYNPMIYGQWIRHIVRQGNVVIYPRYQKTIRRPLPKKFSKNVVTAIHDALDTLQSDQHINPLLDNFSIVGHSYGGTITADITVHWQEHEIPKPKSIFLCAPGTGPFKAGKLDTYANLPEDLKLLVLVNEKDYVVGDELGRKIFETATNTPQRNLLIQHTDHENDISAGHNETYCVDKAFDSGVRNYTAKRALRITETNAVDYYGYWKLYDALRACSGNGKYCEFAFGNTPQQRSLGLINGVMIRELEVALPTAPLLSEKK